MVSLRVKLTKSTANHRQIAPELRKDLRNQACVLVQHVSLPPYIFKMNNKKGKVASLHFLTQISNSISPCRKLFIHFNALTFSRCFHLLIILLDPHSHFSRLGLNLEARKPRKQREVVPSQVTQLDSSRARRSQPSTLSQPRLPTQP